MSTSRDRTESDYPLVPTPSELNGSLCDFKEVVEDNETFLVVAHESPDGDAIGSTLGMGLLLEQFGKDVTYYNQDKVPYYATFLEGSDRMTSELAPDASFDVTVVLDCGSRDRVGSGFPERGWGESIVVFDHHKTKEEGFADLWIRDSSAAATTELVFRAVQTLGGELTVGLAESLYCGIMTDTGSFRYSNTSRTTFRIAGELLDAGVDSWKMASCIYESQPRERLELLSRVLDTLNLSQCGRLAFIRIEREMFEQTDTGPEMTDGFINYGRSIRGVEVATQLRENGDGTWKVSFRSRGQVDVSALASRFGGGGHHNAAGCQMKGTPDEIEAELEAALVDLLDAPDPDETD